MFQILDPHEDVCSEEGEQCNDYSRLRKIDISCVFKSALIAVVKSV